MRGRKSLAQDRTIDIFSGETREEEKKRIQEEVIEQSKQRFEGMDSRTFVGRWIKDPIGKKYRTRWVLTEGPYGIILQWNRYSGKPETEGPGPDRKLVSSSSMYVSREAAEALFEELLRIKDQKP